MTGLPATPQTDLGPGPSSPDEDIPSDLARQSSGDPEPALYRPGERRPSSCSGTVQTPKEQEAGEVVLPLGRVRCPRRPLLCRAPCFPQLVPSAAYQPVYREGGILD